ncbi:MerR family transcriptional regulator [Paraconexibacter algicola]|uniref:MerR family transcriptional regulator n=1 Tax=Paraconexibacter algicola TaxID=2133960 RepID=UPI00130505B9|nr:MerR family transcriptional regulator [Paraconexibacter algicola]
MKSARRTGTGGDVDVQESWRIGELAAQAGVKPSLIRYYEGVGLLPEPERLSGQRRYDRSTLRRLAVIDVAQRAGLRLDEIKLLVGHGSAPMSEQLRDLATRKLPEIDALIERATRVRAWLQTAGTCDCSTIDECALFDDAPRQVHASPFRLPVKRVGPSA